MPKVHDRGGWPTNEPIDRSEHQLDDWERQTDALSHVLSTKRLSSLDQLRRSIEAIPQKQYEQLSYYERWAEAMEALLVEKNVLTKEEVDRMSEELQTRWQEEL